MQHHHQTLLSLKKQMLLSHLRVPFPKHAVNSVAKNHYQNMLKDVIAL